MSLARKTQKTKTQPHILYVDAFDSFTNNVIGLLEKQTQARITVVRINDKKLAGNLKHVTPYLDAIVIGPGPGHPSNAQDVGLIPEIWQLADEDIIPVFGVCLGFQSLTLQHGAKIRQLHRPRHGIVCIATHRGSDIFEGLDAAFTATQYHSLYADLGYTNESELWNAPPACASLQPLAWDFSDAANGPILMGVRHNSKPFWGVQFHPESICTSASGRQLISNWWKHAQIWLRMRGRERIVMPLPACISNESAIQERRPAPRDTKTITSTFNSPLATLLSPLLGPGGAHVRWGVYQTPNTDAAEVLEALGHSQDDVILLDSQGHARGRYSILGLMVPGKTLKVTYSVKDKLLRYGFDQGQNYRRQLNGIDEVWPLLQDAVDMHNPRRNGSHSPTSKTPVQGCDSFTLGHVPEGSPFWGGFMGYISYEAGLETIDVDPADRAFQESSVPDVNFAFTHRSIVIDHERSVIYVQSLLPNDWLWIFTVGRILDEHKCRKEIALAIPPTPPSDKADCTSLGLESIDVHKLSSEARALDAALATATVHRPKGPDYRSKVLECQKYLYSGDSYELCLTDRSEIELPTAADGRGSAMNDWSLYKRLRRNNPAPFGCFVKLSSPDSNDVVIIGSSPERFLRWTRDGLCQFRPIKGTVKKSPDMSRERAHEILNSSKEQAENLMIVDLIRHDLSGVIGAHNTWVSKLMAIEEYEAVYQLVSVIEGQLPHQSSVKPLVTGMDVLKTSLPPGSMTGAPKKRSCEILQDIEQQPRGVYAGVLGYLDVGGSGDFSVVIRTAVKISDKKHKFESKAETYTIGAGGAVTIQSTDEGEFLEMETKASSVFSALFH